MTDSEKISRLEAELDTLSTQITKLYDKQADIHDKINKIKNTKFTITNSLLGVAANAHIVAINRHEDYHYVMFEFIKIESIGNFGFQVIKSSYREDDGDTTFHSMRTTIPLNYFHSLYDNFDLVSLDESVYKEYIDRLYTLDVDYTNRRGFISTLISKSKSRILRVDE